MTSFLLSRPFHKPKFTLQADCPKLVKQLCCYYGSYIKELAETAADISASLRKDGKYTVSFADEAEIITASPLFDMNRLVVEHTSYDTEFLALHGAAVEHNGSAYVFLAATTCGKTTLTAYLASKGMGYLTDDCVLYHKKTKKIHPCATPIHLREGGLEVLKKHDLQIPFEYVDDGVLQRFTYTPENIEARALPIAGIYFLSRSDISNRNSIDKMDSTTALKRLMESVMPGYRVTREYLQTLIELANIGTAAASTAASTAAGTACYEVTYHDMEFVESVINGQ